VGGSRGRKPGFVGLEAYGWFGNYPLMVSSRSRAGAGQLEDRMSVTALDSSARETITTCNSGAAVVTDTDCNVNLPTRSRHSRRPSAYDGIHRWLDAKRYAEICGRCGTAIPSGAPVALQQRDRKPGTSRFHEVTTCLACAAPWLERHRPHRESCPHCRRPVYRRRWRGRLFCCDRCAWLAASARRRARNALGRERACAACGRSFTATRVDARTCSPACRQKDYRCRFGSG
jgi:hypothetical protein